jgi:hypothetical protein
MTTPPPAFCHRCGHETPTVYLNLSSGHVGNCCGLCRATRKGKPFVSRREIETTNAAIGRREPHELSIRRS